MCGLKKKLDKNDYVRDKDAVEATRSKVFDAQPDKKCLLAKKKLDKKAGISKKS